MKALNGRTIEEAAAEDEKELAHKKVEEFDLLRGKYLAVCAKLADAEVEDTRLGELCDIRDDLIWRIVREPATIPRQQSFKFNLLRSFMHDIWTDGRAYALLQSVRRDADADCNEDGL